MPYRDPNRKRQHGREWIRHRREAFLEGKSCAFCGSTSNLNLHHQDPTEKESHRIWSWKEERRLREIAKCIVLCGSCHTWLHRRLIQAQTGRCLGVYYEPSHRGKKWYAQIRIGGHQVWLGRHETKDEAVAAYLAACQDCGRPIEF